MPRRIGEVGIADQAEVGDQLAGDPPAFGSHLVSGPGKVAEVDLRRAMIDPGDRGGRAAEPNRFEPPHLLALELGVVRDQRHSGPPGGVASLGRIAGGEQDLFLSGGKAEQPDDHASEVAVAAHAAASWPSQASASSADPTGLYASIRSIQSTMMMILLNPTVCRRLSADPGSRGL